MEKRSLMLTVKKNYTQEVPESQIEQTGEKNVMFERYKGNPIIEPTENDWESCATFNPAAIFDGKTIHLLYRAIGEYKNYISRVGYAVSKDGINFKRYNKPVLEPTEKYDKWGCEDPRITKIEDEFYITYTALSQHPLGKLSLPRVALASTKDFINFKKHGIITPEGTEEKDVVLFPEKIKGRYVMLHRPYNWIKKFTCKKNGKLYLKTKEDKLIEWPAEKYPDYIPEKPSIWIAYSSDLKHWSEHKVVMEPKAQSWQSEKIGAGPSPIKTDKGWLLIYHGIDKNTVYRAGIALLDLENPGTVTARSLYPALEPKKDYEKKGDTKNTVFPEGAIIRDGRLFIYYGAADKTCCLATCKLDKLLSSF